MANHKSAKKRIIQTIKKTERNKAYKTRSKNLVTKLRTAIEAKDKAVAEKLLKDVDKNLQTFASKGVYKRSTVGRKIGRLHKQVNAI